MHKSQHLKKEPNITKKKRSVLLHSISSIVLDHYSTQSHLPVSSSSLSFKTLQVFKSVQTVGGTNRERYTEKERERAHSDEMGCSGKPPAKTQSPKLDFRSHDEAWYNTELYLVNEKLNVKYDDFPDDEYDDVFNAGDFKSLKEIEDFKNKFRLTSLQLQDHDCSKVIEGMTVCAAYTFSDTADIKFYDAVVDAVICQEHTFSMGEDVCTCTFVVFWDHGSMAGSKTPIHVQDICILQPGNVLSNPALASFIKMSKMKFELASHNSSVVSEDDCLVCGASNCCCGISTTKYKFKSTHSKPRAYHVEDTNVSKGLVGTPQTFKGGSHNHFEEIEQDIDLGAQSIPTENFKETNNSHFILIENLEKDISPSTIVSFMYKHTSMTSQAYVFPSLSSESYTRGIIIVDSHEKLQKLSDFLHNPAHLVMSSRGRPWVIPEKELIHGTFGESFGSSQPISGVDFGSSRLWNNNEKLGVKIKVVRRGTREFSKGKQLIKLYMELSEHLQRLHKRLALEEEKIWSSSTT